MNRFFRVFFWSVTGRGTRWSFINRNASRSPRTQVPSEGRSSNPKSTVKEKSKTLEHTHTHTHTHIQRERERERERETWLFLATVRSHTKTNDKPTQMINQHFEVSFQRFESLLYLFVSSVCVCLGGMGCEWGLDASAHPSTTILWPRVTYSDQLASCLGGWDVTKND